MRNVCRTLSISILAGLLAAGTLTFADADARSISYDLNIPSEDLTAALQSFAIASHHKLLYKAELTAGRTSRALKGHFTAQEAMDALLSGTGLSYEITGSSVVLIKGQGEGKTSDLREEGTSSSPSGTHQNSGGQPILLAQVGQNAAGPQIVGDDQNSDKKKRKDKEEGLSEIVVTGSRIPTAAGDQTLPVRGYSREDIQNSGQTTLGEFLSTLPDVSTTTSATSVTLGLAGVQTVQLHGLPIGTTISLLDGRRLDPSATGYFNLSDIPLSAVERIEILPVGASAIYGADGLGGAVNIILRKNFTGFEVNARLDTAPGVNNPSGDLAWGKSWERGSVSFMGSYQETGALLGIQREPWSITGLPPNIPAALVSSVTTTCAPGNVYSVDGVSNLPGLSSPHAAIPAGITGTPTIGQFAGTAGQQNLCNAENYLDITPHSQREGALLSAHYEITDSADLFTEVLFSHGHLLNQLGPQLAVYNGFDDTVAANNPYNPFGEAVNVSFEYPGAGAQETQSTTFIRPLIGMRGSVFSDWHYEATAYFSQDRLHDVTQTYNFQGISDALASSNPATALNPFTSGPPGTPQLLSSLIIPGADFSTDDRTVSAQGVLRGPLLQLPAGALQAVIGSEFSQEKEDENETGSLPESLHRNTYAVFSEARVPLLASGESQQGSERLVLTLAGRYDHSNDYGGKATWQTGLLWRASETLSFSGGYGVSYQAPLLSDISGPPSVYPNVPLYVPDPFRGNQLITYGVNFVSGPNLNLKPETGDSFTLGLQYSSQALPGLHTSLTWYDLKIENYIASESYQDLIGYPNLFPGAVTRAPPTPQDQQLGYLGVITQLNDTFYNFGNIHVAGFDADIRYSIDTRAGQFTPSVSIANIYKWQSAIVPGAPETNGVSAATALAFGGGVGWSPRWKGTVGLAWKEGPLSTNLQGRYIGPYLDYQEYVPNNSHEIGNTWIFDFNARYGVGQALASTKPWLAQSYVAFGAVNLLNKIPPFSYSYLYYDPQEYDIRGRYFFLSVGTRL